jgi:hypothetical protein
MFSASVRKRLIRNEIAGNFWCAILGSVRKSIKIKEMAWSRLGSGVREGENGGEHGRVTSKFYIYITITVPYPSRKNARKSGENPEKELTG